MSDVFDPEAVDETIRRKFELGWLAGEPQPIESFLQAPLAEGDLPTLEELILIEMEFAWKQWAGRAPGTAPPASIETYVRRFPLLDRPPCRQRLLDQEARLRQRFEATPTLAAFVEQSSPGGPSRFQQGAAVDRLQLQEPIGRGSFGVVWKAFDPHLRRPVAVKQLASPHQRDADLQTRFRAEARVAARLQHPGIVPVYDLAADGAAEPYYVMKLVHGETFGDIIRRYHAEQKGRPQAGVAFLHMLNVLISVARAVAYAHAQGVLHRDLKPANVLVGAFGETIVLDWGLARASCDPRTAPDSTAGATTAQATQEGAIQGTPAYMAPEQAAGENAAITPRTDAYALGVILYEVLTGRLPFVADSAAAMIERVLREDPPRPRELAHDAPRALEAIALRAMARDPARRYGSVEAFVRDLERYLADEPVEAWIEPWHVRLGRWGRRHRTLVSSAAAAIAIALVSLTAGLVLLARANATERHLRQVAQDERVEAQKQRDRAQKHYRLARESVETYLTKVGEDQRLRALGLEPLRRDLLHSARAFFDRLAAEEDDPSLRGERALAYFKLSDIEAATGNTPRALDLAQQGTQVMEALLRESPDDLGVIQGAIQGDQWHAQTLGKSSRFDAAETLYGRSFERCEAALKRHPDDRKLRELLISGSLSRGLIRLVGRRYEAADADFAVAHRELTNLREREGESEWILTRLHQGLQYRGTTALFRQDLQRAREDIEASGAVLTRLREAKPRDPDLKNYQASQLLNLANVERLSNHPQEAERLYGQALGLLEALTDEHPLVTSYRLGLAGLLTNLGQMAADKDQFELALTRFNRAVQLLEALIKLEPNDALARQGLTRALWSRGRERAIRSQRAAGLADLDGALQYADPATAVPIRSRRALILAQLGRHVEAARAAEAIADALAAEPELAFTNARILAESSRQLGADGDVPLFTRAVGALRLQAAAVAALRDLKASGYFNAPARRAELNRDPWLDPLRSRADFRKLLE